MPSKKKRINCISSSNIVHARNESTSLRICNIVSNIVREKSDSNIITEVISLIDYNIKPCIGCGYCYLKQKCKHDTAFNDIYLKLIDGNALIIVSAHYAPIPAKLCIMLEKIEQFIFLERFNNEAARSPLFGLPLGVIAHGGGTIEVIQSYEDMVIKPIVNALSWPVEMKIIKIDIKSSNGVLIPV